MMAFDERYGQVFIAPAVVGLCVGWAILWHLLHDAIAIWEVAELSQSVQVSEELRANERDIPEHRPPRHTQRWGRRPTNASSKPAHRQVGDRGIGQSCGSCSEVAHRLGDGRRANQSFGTWSSTSSSPSSDALAIKEVPWKATITNRAISSFHSKLTDLNWVLTQGNKTPGNSGTSLSNVIRNIPLKVSRKDPCAVFCRKARRAMLYSVASTLAGTGLIVESFFAEDPLKEFLMSFSAVHQAFFTMAVGHWVIAVWEETQCRHFHVKGNPWATFPADMLCNHTRATFVANVVHHVVLLSMYVLFLSSRRLGGLGVHGLLLEALSTRFLIRQLSWASPELTDCWLCTRKLVRKHWLFTALVFAAFRGFSIGLCLFTFVPGGRGARLLQEVLDVGWLALYYVLAIIFLCANLRSIGLMTAAYFYDLAQSQLLQDALEAAENRKTEAARTARGSCYVGNNETIWSRADIRMTMMGQDSDREHDTSYNMVAGDTHQSGRSSMSKTPGESLASEVSPGASEEMTSDGNGICAKTSIKSSIFSQKSVRFTNASRNMAPATHVVKSCASVDMVKRESLCTVGTGGTRMSGVDLDEINLNIR